VSSCVFAGCDDFLLLATRHSSLATWSLYLSTLSEYVEALGGKLEIRAVFPGREVRISQFEELPK